MPDEFAQFGGQEAAVDEFAEFGGQMADAVASPKNDDDAIMARMARLLFAPVQNNLDFARGLLPGIRREEMSEDAPLAEKAGQVAGRYALPAAGALAAGAATGGLGLIPAAAAVGLGAGAGEAYGQIAARAAGGNAPETSTEAAAGIVKTGLETAFAELGFGAGIATFKAVAPTLLQVFAKIPAESIKRVLNKPDIAKIGTKAKTYTELQAAKALRDTQRAVESLRVTKGKAVDAALEGFGQATKGAKVVDASNVATALDDVLESSGAGNQAVAALLPPKEIKRLKDSAAALKKNPLLTPGEAVKLRRAIDDLTAFKGGGVQQVSSAVGQRAAREMGAALRQSIGDAAEKAGYSALREANRDFSQFAGEYESIGKMIGTKGTSVPELLAKARMVGGKFNQGGAEARALEQLAERFPQAGKLLDALAARELTRLPTGTPSGAIKDLLRLALAPQIVGVGIKAGAKASPAIRQAARVGGAGAGSR